MSAYLHDPLRLTASEAAYATSIGEMVALDDFTLEQGLDLIYLWPGRPGTTKKIDPRHPLRPTYWLKDSTGWPLLHGLHTRMCHAMRDSAKAMGGELARTYIEMKSQEIDGRKVAGPLLARGASRDQVIAEIKARCPLLDDGWIEKIADEEAAWWLRSRYDRELGPSTADLCNADYENHEELEGAEV
jgi:hypothetical protein